MSATPSALTGATVTRAAALLVTTLALMVSTLLVATPSARAESSAPDVSARTAAAGALPGVGARLARAKSIALGQLGDPYRYGAAGPNAFDCSGLVYFATHRAGFRRVPRSSGAQAGFMRPVAKNKMRPGDFMYFYGSGGVYHAGIFLGWAKGGARMLHSPGSGRRVTIARPWTNRWFGRTLR